VGLDKEALKRLIEERDIESLADLDGLLKDISKEVIRVLYDGEMTKHLGYGPHTRRKVRGDGTSRNGYGTKTVQTVRGSIVVSPPRDRNGSFSPQVIKKRQRDPFGIEDRVNGLYARGMSTRDIQTYLLDLYGYRISAQTVSMITNSALRAAREWQARKLEPEYAMVYLDDETIKLRQRGKVRAVSLYLIGGISLRGEDSCLGLYIDTVESDEFGMGVLNDLKSRGLRDALIFIVGDRCGISQAIKAVYPSAQIQACIVHQVRKSLRFVKASDGHRSLVARDLKAIYQAETEESARVALEAFALRWDGPYAYISQSWRRNWDTLGSLFLYPSEIRRMICTIPSLENFRQIIRKNIKKKSIFPTADSVLKLCYLVLRELETRTGRHGVARWERAYQQLIPLFRDRFRLHS
jgi:putative transposase